MNLDQFFEELKEYMSTDTDLAAQTHLQKNLQKSTEKIFKHLDKLGFDMEQLGDDEESVIKAILGEGEVEKKFKGPVNQIKKIMEKMAKSADDPEILGDILAEFIPKDANPIKPNKNTQKIASTINTRTKRKTGGRSTVMSAVMDENTKRMNTVRMAGELRDGQTPMGMPQRKAPNAGSKKKKEDALSVTGMPVLITDITDKAMGKFGEIQNNANKKSEGFFKRMFGKKRDSGGGGGGGLKIPGLGIMGILATIAGAAFIGEAFLRSDSLKGTFKLAGKLVMKLFGSSTKLLKVFKRIPFLGSLISFGLAYQRFKQGDVVGGILEVASGIANFFPGIGTVISIGIDMLLAMKDLATGGPKAAASMTVGQQAGKVWDMLKSGGKWIAGKLKNFIYWFGKQLGKGIEFFFTKAAPYVLKKIGQFFWATIDWLKTLTWGDLWDGLVGIGQFFYDGIAMLLKGIWDGFSPEFKEKVLTVIEGVMDWYNEWIAPVVDAVVDIFKKAFEGLGILFGWLETALEKLFGALEWVEKKVKAAVDGFFEMLGLTGWKEGVEENAADGLVQLHTGGMVGYSGPAAKPLTPTQIARNAKMATMTDDEKRLFKLKEDYTKTVDRLTGLTENPRLDSMIFRGKDVSGLFATAQNTVVSELKDYERLLKKDGKDSDEVAKLVEEMREYAKVNLVAAQSQKAMMVEAFNAMSKMGGAAGGGGISVSLPSIDTSRLKRIEESRATERE